MAESPKLPADIIRPVAKPEGLSEEEKAALHNVTSALCNRKQIRDVVEAAVMGTCIALRVPMPEKMNKGRKGKKSGREDTEEQADDRNDSAAAAARGGKGKEQEGEEEEQSGLEEELEPVLLKRKRDKAVEDGGDLDSGEEDGPSDDEIFEGFPDSDAEEQAWARYDGFVAGSSDEDESDENGPIEEDDFADSRSRSVRKSSADDMSISSAASSSEGEEEDPELSESESSGVSPPPKKARAAKAGPISAGNSAFLPTLMGGYISGSESEASDLDDGPPRKNRRGQRARQAIWEKKYKDKAKHVQKQQEMASSGRDQGWDMKRGAVGDDGDNKPWKKGIRNPFESKHVHPERQRQMQGARHQDGEGNRTFDESKPKAPTKRDDTGSLHPSWAAAKKAKEEGQKIAFQGHKVVFD